jgi:four helix bundle protein
LSAFRFQPAKSFRDLFSWSFTMQDFQDLRVWQKSHQVTLAVYEATRTYPREEIFGLTSQTRRAAGSIPANISEGCGRGSDPDFKRFLHVAMGSACELQYHLILGRDLKFLEQPLWQSLTERLIEVKRMLSGLIQTVEGKER